MTELTLIIFVSISFCIILCNASRDKCMYIYHSEYPTAHAANCTKEILSKINKICNKTFIIFYVKELPPYSDPGILERIVQRCCVCMRPPRKYYISTPLQLTPFIANVSDFVYPLLASSSAISLYGSHFIPVIRAPNFYYITTKDGPVLVQLVLSCLALYPLIIICLLMAVISGFCAWAMETWFNKEEFPRAFLVGWFEGFWWSFISMTTVGYGDKTPRTVPARFFSVLWILIGISVFGIVTASLTTALTNAVSPPPPKMYGADVGVLRFREYDASFAASSGGVITRSGSKDVDFRSDIMDLIRKLRNKKINGILLDKHTLAYVIDYLKDDSWKNETNADLLQDMKFFINNTLRTEQFRQGEELSYGILVKHTPIYEYFRNAFMDNRLPLETTLALKWNKRDEAVAKASLFDASGPYFVPAIKGIAIILTVICVFGVLYELKRLNCVCTATDIFPKKEETDGELYHIS